MSDKTNEEEVESESIAAAEALLSNRLVGEPTDEQVERAAEAIEAFERAMPSGPFDIREQYRGFARAALTAAGVAPSGPIPGKRLDPEFRATLVDIAQGSIESVWADVTEGVTAETLAQNVVGAQEFAWIARGFPVAGVAPQAPRIDREKLIAIIEEETASYDPVTGFGSSYESLKRADGSDMSETAADAVIRAAFVTPPVYDEAKLVQSVYDELMTDSAIADEWANGKVMATARRLVRVAMIAHLTEGKSND